MLLKNIKEIRKHDKKQNIFKVVCLTPQCTSYSGVKLCGVHPTTGSSDYNFEEIPPVTPQSQENQISQKLCDVHHTAESNCTMRSQNGKIFWSLVAFKGTIIRNSFTGKHIYHERRDFKYKRGVY